MALDVTAIRITPRPGLFTITDYPNTTVGDDATGLRAAVDAAYAAGGGVVQLETKVGGYNMSSIAGAGNLAAITNRENSGIAIEIRGRGPSATLINLHTPVAHLIGAITIASSNPVYSPISLFDFTLDCASVASAPFKGLLIHYGSPGGDGTNNSFSTTGRHIVERVNVQRAGHAVGASRKVIKWNVNRFNVAQAQTEPTAHLQGLRVRQCDWGHGLGDSTTRGAGQAGVTAFGFVTGDKNATAGVFSVDSIYGTYDNPANVIVDDFIIEDLKFTGGRSPCQRSSGAGAAVQLGGDGIVEWCHIRDCSWENSEDVGIELDGIRSGIIEGCTAFNGDGTDFLLLACGSHSGTHDADQKDFIVRDCESIQPAVDKYGTPVSVAAKVGSGFRNGHLSGGMFDGRVTYQNCHAKLEGPMLNAQWVWEVGASRETIIRDCRVTVEDTATRGTGSITFSGITLNACGRPQTVRVENFRVDMFRKVDTVSTGDTALTLGAVNDLDLQINGLRFYSSGIESNSKTRSLKALALNGTGVENEDTWTSDLLQVGQKFVSGVAADYVYDGTNHLYTATSNLSTEHRALYITSMLAGFGFTGTVGRVKDSGFWAQFTPGTTLTGYKAGTFAKTSPDGLSYLEAYVTDNGTNSFLCVDKVLAGSRTSLLSNGVAVPGAQASTTWTTVTPATITSPPTGTSGVGLQLSTRLATGTTHYESLIVQGDVLIVEHAASAKPGSAGTRMGGTGDAYLSVTLTGTDIKKVGSLRWGEVGWTQIPISNDAQLRNMLARQFSVLRGTIRDVSVDTTEQATGNHSGIQIIPRFAVASGGVSGTAMAPFRIDGQLAVENCDFRALATTGSVKDYDFSSNMTQVTQYVTRRGNKLVAANVADQTISYTGSAFTWQNTTGHWGTYTIQGGTVSKVEISKDNSTYRDTGVIAGSFRLAPNWYIKITYTGAPTSAFVAED